MLFQKSLLFFSAVIVFSSNSEMSMLLEAAKRHRHSARGRRGTGSGGRGGGGERAAGATGGAGGGGVGGDSLDEGHFIWLGSDGWSGNMEVSSGNEKYLEGAITIQPASSAVKGW